MSDARAEVLLETRQSYLVAAQEFADVARTVLAEVQASGVQAEKKLDASVVTQADKRIEEKLRALIAERFPDHGVIGEEFSQHLPQSDFQWILDPIDGTEELATGIALFGCIIALHYKGLPLVSVIDHPELKLRTAGGLGLGVCINGNPVRLDFEANRMRAEATRFCVSRRSNFLRGQDHGFVFDAVVKAFPNVRIYSSCYSYTALFQGSIDVMLDYNLKLWDLAANQVLIEELGGSFEMIREVPSDDGSPMYCYAFGKPELVSQVASMVRSLVPE